MANRIVAQAVRTALISSGALGCGFYAAPLIAQDQVQSGEQLQEIVVTGSRIVRSDFTSSSPITTFTAEQVARNADITLDTFLNSLPNVNPSGTTTSNNPGNGGQSNVDLGLGANRNLVLIDGRRAMPSASDLTVDINTIPQAMIESIEIVTGGASAVYGADAVAGAVNFKLKNRFQGADLRYSYSNAEKQWDAKEYNISAVLGANFSEDRGNAIIGFDYSSREAMIKAQRPFSAIATSTTSYVPEGNYIQGSNPVSQAAVDTLFARYGVAAGAARPNLISFNRDGTLFSRGIYNSPIDVQNFRYPIDLNVNTRFYPDFYSFNFDAVNILTLPLERRSFLTKLNYELDGGVEIFALAGWTSYTADTALAPTPFPTVTTRAPGEASSIQATSAFVAPGRRISNNLIIPVTNPWIPADFRTLLASRTGDDPNLVGSGATEPFQFRQRSLSAGLRQSTYDNTVVQYTAGARGKFFSDKWGWEISYSEGYTDIKQTQAGNLDTNKLLELAAAADGGVSRCGPTGFNLFGRNPLSAQCVAYISVSSNLQRSFEQKVGEAFVRGDLFEMPAGPLSVVLGAQGRYFKYSLDPGPSAGPISGFNAQTPADSKNSFKDVFMEALVPLAKDAAWAKSFELNFGYRMSTAEFEDKQNVVTSPSDSSSAYFASLSWRPLDYLRVRTGFQRAVRAPNFTELFDGGGSAPQYFDPCSSNSAKRRGADAVAMRALCLATGLGAAAADSYIATPGGQISITTSGNTALKPETADSFSIGLVFDSPWEGAWANLQASLDYSKIKLKDTINTPAPNVIVAACYNYYGTNPTYSAANPNCQGVIRAGGDILGLSSPFDPTGNGLYPGINGGVIQGDSVDMQVAYGSKLPVGDLKLNLLLTRNLSNEQSEASDLPLLDYTGTVTFFGAGLGSSNPKMKANLSAIYTVGDFAFDTRVRWIGAMKNRANAIFPGETSFTGVPAVTYIDVGASWKMGFIGTDSMVRIGVNNVTNKTPPLYAPNVQSGTESSLYDLVGRRIFGQVIVKF